MKNKIRIISVIGLLIYSMSVFIVLLSVSAAAVDQYDGKIYRCTSTVFTADAGTISTLPNGITYTINNSDVVYTGFSVFTNATRGDYVVQYRRSNGSVTNASVDDVLYFSADVRNIAGGSKRVLDACFEPVPVWSSDDSSPYRSMYSTLSHYIFNDSFEDVPFGDMWITFAAVIGCLFVAGLPFLIVYWILRRI